MSDSHEQIPLQPSIATRLGASVGTGMLLIGTALFGILLFRVTAVACAAVAGQSHTGGALSNLIAFTFAGMVFASLFALPGWYLRTRSRPLIAAYCRATNSNLLTESSFPRVGLILLGFVAGAIGWSSGSRGGNVAGLFVAAALGTALAYTLARWLFPVLQPTPTHGPATPQRRFAQFLKIASAIAAAVLIWNVSGLIGATRIGRQSALVDGWPNTPPERGPFLLAEYWSDFYTERWTSEQQRSRLRRQSLWARVPVAPEFWLASAEHSHTGLRGEFERLLSELHDAKLQQERGEQIFARSMDALEAGVESFNVGDEAGGANAIHQMEQATFAIENLTAAMSSSAQPEEVYHKGWEYLLAVEWSARLRAMLVSAAALTLALGSLTFVQRAGG